MAERHGALMGNTLTIGKVQAVFAADSTKFDVSTAGVERQLDQVGKQATQTAAKVAEAGAVIDRAAASQERSKERMRRAWQQELQAQDRTIAKEKEVARARELAALQADIEARNIEKVTLAHKAWAAISEKNKEAFSSGIEWVGGGLAAGAVIGFFKEMITSTMETGVELGHLSQQTGVTVEQLSVLKYAASVTGVEFEVLTKGFKKLSTEVFEADRGGKEAQKAFAALGISAADLKAKGDDLWGVLTMIADRFKEMPDGITKNALATELFGRAGQNLIPILNQGSASLAALKAQAPIFSEKEVQNLEEMHRNVKELSGDWERLKVSIVGAVAAWYAWDQHNLSRPRWTIGAFGVPEVKWVPPAASSAEPISSPNSQTASAPMEPPASRGSVPRTADRHSKDPDVITLNLSRLEDAWVEEQTKTRDANRAFYAQLDADAAKAQKDWDTAANVIDWKALAFKTNLPPIVLAPEMPGRFSQLKDAVDATIKSFTNVDGELAHLFTGAVGSLNSEMAKAMTGQRTNFAGAFRGIGESLTRLGLQRAEAALMQVHAGTVLLSGAAGIGAPGAGATPFPGMPNGNPGPAGSGVTSRGGGWLPWVEKAIGLVGGFFGHGAVGGTATVAPDFSADAVQIPYEPMYTLGDLPGRAFGGPVLAGMPYMVGEEGPEPFVPSSNGHIVPNHATRGQGAYYEIHAEGADAAAIQQRVGRALEQVHGSAVQNATMVMAERRRRSPNRGM
jgi:hypothetical protein